MRGSGEGGRENRTVAPSHPGPGPVSLPGGRHHSRTWHRHQLHHLTDLLTTFSGIFAILIIPLMMRAGGYPVAAAPKLKTERLRTIWKLTGKNKNQDPRHPFSPGASPGAESRMVQL